MFLVQVVQRRGLTSPHGESATLLLHPNLSEGGAWRFQCNIRSLACQLALLPLQSIFLDSLEFGRMALSVETLQGYIVTLEWRETAPPVLKNVSASPIQWSVIHMWLFCISFAEAGSLRLEI